MPLFQLSIQKKFIQDLNLSKVEIAYQKFIEHFANLEIQENIRNAKEEEYQEGFVRDLFVNVLGYVLKPQPNYNFVLEKKNEKDSKKADGAIVKAEKTKAVLELKSIRTANLQAIQNQAFGYKNSQKDCTYVITANFQKLRFYIENSVDFEEFDLFDLSFERFKLLYLCLHAENLLADLPLKIKKASLIQEEQITQKLYHDYSLFKTALLKDISAKHPSADRLFLLKKTQKLLDRFLFIFFAEDKGLLHPNSVAEILRQWEQLKEMDAYQPLYQRFKQYFGYLNSGYKSKFHNVFAYNGGLFSPDEWLDKLEIQDNLLYNHCATLARYDFDTEIDTNILGHIFEHSLNEIDEAAAQAEGNLLEKAQTKRKKDGIFYTPRYITKYIVDLTLGELCKKKKTELGLESEALNHSSISKERLATQIETYQQWLLQLTILDPACGSGAFLNQALEFLIAEHHTIADMRVMLLGETPTQNDSVSEILANNLFGVDINEESVEIAKLSLWLRTAKVGRKLNDLSEQIKCGNSLVSDAEVAGNLAFQWQEAFPSVFEKGGFDVVIGNPPYVRQELLGEKMKTAHANAFPSVANGTADLYVYFYEQGVRLLKPAGKLGYITPNKWLERKYGVQLRNFLKPLHLEKIIDFGELRIFADAATEPAIVILQNSPSDLPFEFASIKTLAIAQSPDLYTFRQVKKEALREDIWRFADDIGNRILEKFAKDTISLSSYANHHLYRGLLTGSTKAFIIDQLTQEAILEKDPNAAVILKKEVEGEDFGKWHLNHSGKYLIASGYDIDIPKLYPGVYQHLQKFQNELVNRADKGKNWYNLRACVYYPEFEKPKLIYYHTALHHHFYYDTEGYYLSSNCYFITNADRYLQCILNSKVFHFCKKYLFPSFGDAEKGGRIRLDANKMLTLPIKLVDASRKETFRVLAESITEKSNGLQRHKLRFKKLVQSMFPQLAFTSKIENWHTLTFGDFREEFYKQKVLIPMREAMEFQELFEHESAQVKRLELEVKQLESVINRHVYEVYGLDEEEILFLENQ